MMTTIRGPLTTFSVISLLMICLLFFSATSGYCTVENDARPGPRKIIAAIPVDFPPTYFLDKSGKPAGYAVDVMNELARRTGLTVEYVHGRAWSEIIQMVLNGKADLIPCMIIDEERMDLFAFTDSMDFQPVNLIVTASNHRIREISPGLTIGVIQRSAAENILTKNQTIKLTAYSNFQTLLFDLLTGRLNGIVAPTPNMMKLAADIGVDDKIKVVGKPIIEAKRGIALRKGETELLNRLNKALKELIGSPEYRNIYVKWYGKPKPYWTVDKIAAVSGISLFLIVCGMVFWRYRSILRINQRLILSITGRRQAEEALQKSEEKYRTLIQKIQTAVIVHGPDTRILTFNAMALDLLGLTEDQMLGKTALDPAWHFLRDDGAVLPLEEYPVNQVIATRRALRNFIIVIHRSAKKEEKNIWVLVNADPVFAEDGEIAEVVVTFIDISSRKQAEEQIKVSLKEKTVLLKEIQHRVKNNLLNISGILALQLNRIKDDESKDKFITCINRINAMTKIHTRLYQSDNYSFINFKGYIEELVWELSRSYGFPSENIITDIEDISIDINMAIPAGLIVNELVSNAMKHAFPPEKRTWDERNQGAKDEEQRNIITVTLKKDDEDDVRNSMLDAGDTMLDTRCLMLDARNKQPEIRNSQLEPPQLVTLTVSDNGIGIPPHIDFRNTESVGLTLLGQLTEQVNGSMELIRDNGTEFIVTFSIDQEKTS